jgi:hypothetical protein
LISGPSFDVSRDSQTATEVIIVRASDVEAFRSEAMPPPLFIEDISILPLYRRMPGTQLLLDSMSGRPFNPDLPGDPFKLSNEDTRTGHQHEAFDNDPENKSTFGDFTNASAPDGTYSDFYELTLNYSSQFQSNDNQEDPNKPETFLEVTKNAGGQFLSIPPVNTSTNEGAVPTSPGETGGTVTKADGSSASEEDIPNETNQDQNQGITFTIPTIEWTMNWPRVLNPRFDVINRMIGSVNASFMPVFDNAPIETVLFAGYTAKRNYLWVGFGNTLQPYSLSFKFSQRMIQRSNSDISTFATVNQDDVRVFGWNHQFSPTKGEWVRIIMANGKSLFDRQEFLPLFQTALVPPPTS